MKAILLGVASGWTEVRTHKLRSALTMLGIVLGAAALVGMLGVVRGLLQGWERFIQETGGIERIEVNDQAPPEEQRERAALSPGRTLRDVEALKDGLPGARLIAAEVGVWGARLWHRGRAQRENVRGVLPEVSALDNFEIGEGRMIADLDNVRQSQVVVLGPRIAERLFAPGASRLGEVVTINSQPFTVVGITKDVSSGRGDWWANQKNRVVFVPLTTAQTLFKTDEKVDNLIVQVASFDALPESVAQITNILTHTHRDVQDFRLQTREEMVQRFEQTRRSYIYSLGGVAAISLVVGGIGIMNVMLASIGERIREIGVRRALGAKRGDILVQILAESFTLSIMGGVVGLLASVGLIALLQKVMLEQNRPVLSMDAMAFGIGSSALIGIVAGIYPALRASRMSPVEALRTD